MVRGPADGDCDRVPRDGDSDGALLLVKLVEWLAESAAVAEPEWLAVRTDGDSEQPPLLV